MQKNFRYLDELIHSGAKEVVLTSDIVLDEGEESEYLQGIHLDVDGLIIDGNGYAIDACGKAGIFYCTAEATIKNVVLKNGIVAIHNFKGILTIKNSTLSYNTAKVAGGAIYNNWAELNIEGSILTDNASGCHGGAIFNVNGTVNISNSELLNNSAKNDGGAIFNGGKLNVKDSKLYQNTANGSGGAIYDNRGEINLINSILSGNISNGIFGGGAIHKNRGILNIADSALDDNSADSDGGAIFNIDGELTITKSSFSNNVSYAKGGAIYDWGTLSIADCEFCENAADECGAVFAKNKDELNLRDCNFKDNRPEI